MYTIRAYTRARAKKLGVTVKLSTRKFKKLDVFKNGEKVASVGDVRYKDYPTYLAEERSGKHPKGYADKRRKAYKTRHKSDRHRRGTPGWYADQLLW